MNDAAEIAWKQTDRTRFMQPLYRALTRGGPFGTGWYDR
jgi:hypothetical protein